MKDTLTPETRASLRKIAKLEGQAYPTLVLFACGVALWGGAGLVYASGWVGVVPLLVLAGLGQYLLYTCLHEAVHDLASPWPWLNRLVGIVASSSLFAPFLGFRYLHLKHHRFTNDPVKDPDIWSARSFLLLRWISQDFYYYAVYWRERRNLGIPGRVEVVVQVLVNLLIAGALVRYGLWEILVFGWLLPARLVVGWLSFVFNYLPHHPHDPKLQNTVYKETNVRPASWLTPLLLFQNFHNIHHLYPAAPFYRYGRIWREGEKEFLRLGTEVKAGLLP